MLEGLNTTDKSAQTTESLSLQLADIIGFGDFDKSASLAGKTRTNAGNYWGQDELAKHGLPKLEILTPVIQENGSKIGRDSSGRINQVERANNSRDRVNISYGSDGKVQKVEHADTNGEVFSTIIPDPENPNQFVVKASDGTEVSRCDGLQIDPNGDIRYVKIDNQGQRISKVKEGADGSTIRTNRQGQIERVVDANGLQYEYAYDNFSKAPLKRVEIKSPDGGLVAIYQRQDHEDKSGLLIEKVLDGYMIFGPEGRPVQSDTSEGVGGGINIGPAAVGYGQSWTLPRTCERVTVDHVGTFHALSSDGYWVAQHPDGSADRGGGLLREGTHVGTPRQRANGRHTFAN